MKGIYGIPAALVLAAQPLMAEMVFAQASPTVVTGFQVQSTAGGIQIDIETQSGSAPNFLPPSPNYRNVLVLDLLDAQLSEGSLSESNPAPGILSVSLDRRTDDSVRLTIIGSEQLPSVSVQDRDPGVVVSLGGSQVPVASVPTPMPVVAPTPLVSQPNPTPAPEVPDLELAEITVLGERLDGYTRPTASTATRTDTPLRDIPQSIQVVPQQVLRDRQVSRVSEVLENVSGVQTDDSFGNTLDRVNIRGFQADVFLENGFRRGSFGGRGLSDPELIEQVEVLKGPASVLYGNVEPGGVVNIVSERPLEEDFAEFSFTTSSLGLARPSFDLSGPLNEEGTVLYRFNGILEYSDNTFRDYDQDLLRYVIAPALTWRISDRTTLDLQVYYSDEERPFDRGIPAVGEGIPAIPFDRRFQNEDTVATIEELSVAYQIAHNFNDQWKLNHNFRFLAADTFDFRLDNWISEDDGTLDQRWRNNDDYLENFSAGVNLSGEFKTGSIEHALLAGIDWSQNIGGGVQRRLPEDPSFFVNIFTLEADPNPKPNLADLTNVVRDNQDRETLIGLYLQDQITFSENLKMLAGVRLDFFDANLIFNGDESNIEKTEVSPRLGLVYQPTPELSIYGSFSQAFTPNPFDLTADGEPIDPEVSQQYEIGIRGEFMEGNLVANLAAYDITKRNVAAPDPNNPDFAIPVGEIGSRGIELDVAGTIDLDGKSSLPMPIPMQQYAKILAFMQLAIVLITWQKM